jgi:SAM-dependent methyltransferase
MNTEFDRLAADYDNLLRDPLRDYFAPGSAFFVTRKLDVLSGFLRSRQVDTRKAVWLDVGCGKGDLLRAGRSSFARVLGCDVSTEMIAAAGDLDVVHQGQPTCVPLADASVDVATAVCVYHHIDPLDRPALTADIVRVLKPGGIFAIVEHNPINPAVQVIIRRTAVDENAILLAARTARRLMRDAGLGVQSTRYFLYLPQRLYFRTPIVERALERVPLGGQYAVFGIKR